MQQPIYRIAKWDQTFETSESRKYKTLTWISMPIGFTSTGYQELLDEFRRDAPAVYGAWCAIAALAATCPERGVLANSSGRPLKLTHMARITGFPAELIERTLTWAHATGWVETDEGSCEQRETSGEEEPAAARNSPLAARDSLSPPEESPGDLPPYREDPSSTLPNLTPTPVAAASERDPPERRPKNEQPRTNNHEPRTPLAAAAEEFVNAIYDQLDPSTKEQTRLAATKLSKAAGRLLTNDYIWSVAVVTEPDLSPGFCSEVAGKISAGQVGRPKSYIDSAMRGELGTLGLRWTDVQRAAIRAAHARASPTRQPTVRLTG
jgi:hypothetical protein